MLHNLSHCLREGVGLECQGFCFWLGQCVGVVQELCVNYYFSEVIDVIVLVVGIMLAQDNLITDGDALSEVKHLALFNHGLSELDGVLALSVARVRGVDNLVGLDRMEEAEVFRRLIQLPSRFIPLAQHLLAQVLWVLFTVSGHRVSTREQALGCHWDLSLLVVVRVSGYRQHALVVVLLLSVDHPFILLRWYLCGTSLLESEELGVA